MISTLSLCIHPHIRCCVWSGPLYNCAGTTDFVSLAYGRLAANEIMLRQSLGQNPYLMFSQPGQNCLQSSTLRSILTQVPVDGGIRCCSNMQISGGTPAYSGSVTSPPRAPHVVYLVFNGGSESFAYSSGVDSARSPTLRLF